MNLFMNTHRKWAEFAPFMNEKRKKTAPISGRRRIGFQEGSFSWLFTLSQIASSSSNVNSEKGFSEASTWASTFRKRRSHFLVASRRAASGSIRSWRAKLTKERGKSPNSSVFLACWESGGKSGRRRRPTRVGQLWKMKFWGLGGTRREL